MIGSVPSSSFDYLLFYFQAYDRFSASSFSSLIGRFFSDRFNVFNYVVVVMYVVTCR